MYQIEESLDSQILSLQKDRPTVVFTEPLDPRILESACYLTRFIKPVLLAPEAEVRALAAHASPGGGRLALRVACFWDCLL